MKAFDTFKRAKGYIFILATILFPNFLLAQSPDQEPTPSQIMVTYRTHQNGIDIRWAPNNHLLFRMANRKGYRLERSSGTDTEWKVVFERQAYSVEEFKAKLDTTNIHVATAAQCLHGQPLPPTNPTDILGTALEQEEEQNMRFAYALLSADFNKQAAEGLALSFRDEDIQPGLFYYYRLYIKDLEENDPRPDTATFIVNTNKVYAPASVQKLFTDIEQERIILKWSKEENNRHFSGYFVEKSIDGGKTFTRVNDEPMATSENDEFEEFNNFHIYSDRAIESGKKYHYRIIGITPFGDEGKYSETIEATALDATGPYPPNKIIAEDNGKQTIKISWEMNKVSGDQDGFAVWRSDSPKGPFYPIHEKLLDNKTRTYIDKTPMPIQSNYYIVYAFDKNGNKSGSHMGMAVWYDTIPPAQPQGLAGYIDTTGLVTLAWAYGNEADLLGYMVYWSNGPDREFYPISHSPVEGNIFLDSIQLKTLTEKIYYKVIAVDFNMNQSKPSKVLELEKPDINPPAAPMLNDFKAFKDSIYLQWSPSPSEDVVAYQILRKTTDQEKYDIILTQSSDKETKFSDKSIEPGVTYQYAVVAIDDARNYSEISKPYVITSLRGMILPTINDLSGQIQESDATFRLQWTPTIIEDCECMIMRNVDEKGWQLLATVPSQSDHYIDKNIFRARENFQYAVKVNCPNGAESPLSNIVIISFENQ